MFWGRDGVVYAQQLSGAASLGGMATQPDPPRPTAPIRGQPNPFYQMKVRAAIRWTASIENINRKNINDRFV
jgi:hypothetical protein